jgi:DNA-binding CsgD family transcriptional regulator
MPPQLLLEIDPVVLADILSGLPIQPAARLTDSTSGMSTSRRTPLLDEARLRALLTAHRLTERERDLVVLDLKGHTRTEIAAILELAPSSVKKYWSVLNAKLGVRNRHMLRRWVLERYCASLVDTPRKGRISRKSSAGSA